MKLVRVKSRKIILPLRFPQEILSNGKLEYFIEGEGYKKTKSYEILTEEIPNANDKMTWFYICYLTEKYGMYVGLEYAKAKVAGIIANQTLRGKMTIYKTVKDILPETNEGESFFELLKCDYMLSCLGIFSFDVVSLDETLTELDPEYDGAKTTYKGETGVSLSEYIKRKFGEPYVKVIKSLINK